MKRIVRRYGRIFRFKNILGSDTALDLYLSWILEEVDFKHEARNIVKYSQSPFFNTALCTCDIEADPTGLGST